MGGEGSGAETSGAHSRRAGTELRSHSELPRAPSSLSSAVLGCHFPSSVCICCFGRDTVLGIARTSPSAWSCSPLQCPCAPPPLLFKKASSISMTTEANPFFPGIASLGLTVPVLSEYVSWTYYLLNSIGTQKIDYNDNSNKLPQNKGNLQSLPQELWEERLVEQ